MEQSPSPAEPARSIFGLSVPGRRACTVAAVQPGEPAPESFLAPSQLRSRPPGLPEVSELDIVRHFTNLSRKNWSIDVGAYPLGSCTMKYNPKVHDQAAALPGFRRLHPWQPEDQIQGALGLLWEMQRHLAEITGMGAVSFQPAAGAAGELTGLLIIRAHLQSQGDGRKVVLIPDTAHGTNPATVTRAGYRAVEIPSDDKGLINIADLEARLDGDVAALMITNPNTLGLFETQIQKVADLIHAAGGLLYYDGANLNAIMGITRPGDMGFDVVHTNLHKTFTTPHGGGGPGSGPVAVTESLARYLPAPVIAFDESSGRFYWDDRRPDSIGRVHGFYGNFAVIVRAYAYICSLGAEGLRRVSERAVLNANYLKSLMQDAFPAAFEGLCMHEFVATAKRFRKDGVRAYDFAKRLIDLGFHPPTMYFPQVVEEALMAEPTETESKQTLDALGAAFARMAEEAKSNPEILKKAPAFAPVGRLDEARAARHLNLRWRPGQP